MPNSNEYWPAEYFIDSRGNVRHAHFGEGDYAADERVIRSLLAAATGACRVQPRQGTISASADVTPESYLASNRAQRFTNGPITDAPRTSERHAPPDQTSLPTPAAGTSAVNGLLPKAAR